MGILPYYARYGLSGEQPRTKDDFERYEEQKGAWESVRSGWRTAHATGFGCDLFISLLGTLCFGL